MKLTSFPLLELLSFLYLSLHTQKKQAGCKCHRGPKENTRHDAPNIKKVQMQSAQESCKDPGTMNPWGSEWYVSEPLQ